MFQVLLYTVWRPLPSDHQYAATITKHIPLHIQAVEDDNETLSSQISLLEDQLKMASVASKRKVEGIEIKHKELGERLQELLRLHKDIATDLVAWFSSELVYISVLWMLFSIASGVLTGMIMIHECYCVDTEGIIHLFCAFFSCSHIIDLYFHHSDV